MLKRYKYDRVKEEVRKREHGEKEAAAEEEEKTKKKVPDSALLKWASQRKAKTEPRTSRIPTLFEILSRLAIFEIPEKPPRLSRFAPSEFRNDIDFGRRVDCK